MEERRKNILEELKERGCVRVDQLSAKLGCCEATIRSEIRNMDREGLLIRIRGGALSIEKRPFKEYSAESVYRHMDRKREIAERAYRFIGDRDTIIIDDSSTSFYLALYIKKHQNKRIAVMTNSLISANELAGLSYVDLYMVGGSVGGQLAATRGEDAAADIRKFQVDKAFVGADGINFGVGITSIATSQMQVKQALLSAAQNVYVLADSSKFGGGYLSVVCPFEAIHKIITDKHIKKDYIKRAKQERIPLVIA